MFRRADVPDERLPADPEAYLARDTASDPSGRHPHSSVDEEIRLQPLQRPHAPYLSTEFTQGRDQRVRPSPALAAGGPTHRNHHAWMLADARDAQEQQQQYYNVSRALGTHHRGGSSNEAAWRSERCPRAVDGMGMTATTSRTRNGNPRDAFTADKPRSRGGHCFAGGEVVDSLGESDHGAHAGDHSYGQRWLHRSTEQPERRTSAELTRAKFDEEAYEYDSIDNDGSGDQFGGEADEEEEADDGEVATTSSAPKPSRYLREMDRRVILERLARGEKQAALAKEFHVSRAAICNLFKHRHEVLARSDENPFAKHPKKKKKKKAKLTKTLNYNQEHRSVRCESAHASSVAATSFSNSPRTSQSSRSGENVAMAGRLGPGTLHIVKSAALPLLLSAISDRSRSLADFRRNSERVFWLILEDALALVPTREVRHGSQETGHTHLSYEIESPPCAISMEPQSVSATPMLDIFQLMEPQQPSAVASVATHRDDAAFTVEIAAGGGLPPALRGYNVFLLDVVAASGEAVCAVVERLVRGFGVLEANVSVVALFTSSEVVAMVQCKYPLATIVTARIDSSITRRRIASTPVDVILQRVRTAYGESGTRTRTRARA